VPEGQVGRYVARTLGGRASAAPTWSLLRRAVTVHNLGGVPMGTDRAHGVIDDYGEVHGHRDLYVVDGAAVPSATGVNPSASILAMAERNVSTGHYATPDLDQLARTDADLRRATRWSRCWTATRCRPSRRR
jgi:choline dehydrogenase-like flavoprotein